MRQLIKLSDTHYIVVDDSEIKEGDFVLTKENTSHKVDYVDAYTKINEWKKITHSTQPLEETISYIPPENYPIPDKVFNKIEPLSLSEIEEAINGYSDYKFVND